MLARVEALLDEADEVAKVFIAVRAVCMLARAFPAVLSAVIPLLMLSTALA